MRKFGLSREDSEDLVQETFEALFTNRPRARNPEAYATTMFYHACCDRLRRNTRDRGRSARLEDVDAPDTLTPDRIHAVCAVNGAFRLIDPTCQKLVTDYYLAGHTLQETSDRSALPLTSTWHRLKQCIKRMLVCLR
ncbi:MAG: sigma-70 family RNA polymerase sigma factor [Thermoanaerobaculia bacterium]